VRAGEARRFGLITTNSLRQTFNRRVVQAALDGEALPVSRCGAGHAGGLMLLASSCTAPGSSSRRIEEAASTGLGSVPGLERHIREYRNGRDLMASPRDVLVIDLFGLSADDVRAALPGGVPVGGWSG
jgi:hypothetical protein